MNIDGAMTGYITGTFREGYKALAGENRTGMSREGCEKLKFTRRQWETHAVEESDMGGEIQRKRTDGDALMIGRCLPEAKFKDNRMRDGLRELLDEPIIVSAMWTAALFSHVSLLQCVGGKAHRVLAGDHSGGSAQGRVAS